MTTGKKILYLGNKLALKGFTPTSIDTLGKLLELEGYHVSYASEQRNPMVRMLDMIMSILRFRSYDYVLIDTYSTTAFNYAWLTARLASMLKLKYIPILHGGNMPQRFMRSPRRCRQIFGNSMTNIAVSPYLEQHLKNVQFKSCLIPNSINLKQYPFKKRTMFQPKFLWVRSFHSIYNPELAIWLISKLLKKYPNARLTMVGPDKDGSLDHCKLLAKDLGVEDKIVFTGRLEKHKWIRLAEQHDIFINTAKVDNMPVSLLEAMALGLPIVSTNVGGIPFLIDNGETGLLVHEGNVDSMCLSVERLLIDTAFGTDIANKARVKAEQFDWSCIRHQWMNILSQT